MGEAEIVTIAGYILVITGLVWLCVEVYRGTWGGDY